MLPSAIRSLYDAEAWRDQVQAARCGAGGALAGEADPRIGLVAGVVRSLALCHALISVHLGLFLSRLHALIRDNCWRHFGLHVLASARAGQ